MPRSRLPSCLLLSLLVAGCGGGQGMRMETIGFERQIDPRYVADPGDAPRGRPGQFDLSEWFGAVPLDGHVSILTVDGRLDLVVVEETDEHAIVEWILPEGDDLFLRFADHNFDPDSCPVSGTPADAGIGMLESLDAYRHPIRLVYRLPVRHANLDITSPQLETGTRYFVQGCGIDETGLFTGDATNTVVIEVARALPDLAVAEMRTLGRSPEALGRPFIRLQDLNAATDPEVRGERSVNYRVTVSPLASGAGPVAQATGTTGLLPGGMAWIIPGAGTPDPSDDIRIPDDGRLYDVGVVFNIDSTGITFPEANHFNNSGSQVLQARPKPLILGIDQLRVTENCDGVSPGDWLMMLKLEYHDEERRFIADSTIDVPDRSTTSPKMGFRLHGTNVASSVRAELGFLDCDFDAFTGFALPVVGLVFSIATLAESCGGEEAYEIGGRSDLVGWARSTLVGVTTESAVTFTATASEEDCGPAPFSVDFKLMTQEQAADDGYDLSAVVDVR